MPAAEGSGPGTGKGRCEKRKSMEGAAGEGETYLCSPGGGRPGSPREGPGADPSPAAGRSRAPTTGAAEWPRPLPTHCRGSRSTGTGSRERLCPHSAAGGLRCPRPAVLCHAGMAGTRLGVARGSPG
ncbi:PREDICTED: myosin heavy chain IB-like [Nipponia nippon]|uniref:myosin heavy chain IB-like n=1 Tax=Nipponia nippon TaxID=128390 RepID=UPI000510A3C0|nr:PREDICTED: myosin heavy chain IB-like [Nipponia nippon]